MNYAMIIKVNLALLFLGAAIAACIVDTFLAFPDFPAFPDSPAFFSFPASPDFSAFFSFPALSPYLKVLFNLIAECFEWFSFPAISIDPAVIIRPIANTWTRSRVEDPPKTNIWTGIQIRYGWIEEPTKPEHWTDKLGLIILFIVAAALIVTIAVTIAVRRARSKKENEEAAAAAAATAAAAAAAAGKKAAAVANLRALIKKMQHARRKTMTKKMMKILEEEWKEIRERNNRMALEEEQLETEISEEATNTTVSESSEEESNGKYDILDDDKMKQARKRFGYKYAEELANNDLDERYSKLLSQDLTAEEKQELEDFYKRLKAEYEDIFSGLPNPEVDAPKDEEQPAPVSWPALKLQTSKTVRKAKKKKKKSANKKRWGSKCKQKDNSKRFIKTVMAATPKAVRATIGEIRLVSTPVKKEVATTEPPVSTPVKKEVATTEPPVSTPTVEDEVVASYPHAGTGPVHWTREYKEYLATFYPEHCQPEITSGPCSLKEVQEQLELAKLTMKAQKKRYPGQPKNHKKDCLKRMGDFTCLDEDERPLKKQRTESSSPPMPGNLYAYDAELQVYVPVTDPSGAYTDLYEYDEELQAYVQNLMW